MMFYNKQNHKFEFYPKAFEANRRHRVRDPTFVPVRRKFLRAALMNFLILLVLFLLLFAYLYGALYQLNDRVDHMKIAFVDYDGGVVGTAIRQAYKKLEGPDFPTLIEKTPQEYADEQSLQNAVCGAQYWAAVFVNKDSSTNFANALGGGAAASSYNKSNVLTYIWNEARYPTIADAYIEANIETLSAVAQAELLPIYASSVGTVNINTGDTGAISVVAQSWQLQSINIKPTAQGSRLIYNTILIVLVLIEDFFFLAAINGLYAQFGIFARLWPHRIIFFRTIISLMYTFLGSLCVVSMIYAFRAGWEMSGTQFVATWMALWLFAHLNFLTLDVFTVWLPPQYVPMALITWVVMNVCSVLLPFELSNPFYRWAYVMPAHEVFSTLIDIWSEGCYPSLRYSLTILFVLELTSFILSSLGVYRRSHYAILAEEKKEKDFQTRIDAAMAVERKRFQKVKSEEFSPDSTTIERDESEERKDLEVAEREEIDKGEEEEEHDIVKCDPIRFTIFDPKFRTGLSRARTAG